ncbi:CPBP family intramembrane glutamic endopeptidase [Lentilactobacillus raoultii]|uniref:CPBP family intramembrane glutamic endopeptidase n=1 Tax=Lentilactobacillus raoultii TaxID=1987503 RepID=A0ABW3PWR5_9LACO|nr:type II CAAX endopeptidase family protein [Lentilactobacillus raoultii]
MMQEESKTAHSSKKQQLSKWKEPFSRIKHYLFKGTPISRIFVYLFYFLLLDQIVMAPPAIGGLIHEHSLTYVIFSVIFVLVVAPLVSWFGYKAYVEMVTPNVRIGGHGTNSKQVFKVFTVSLVVALLFTMLSQLIVTTTPNQTFIEQSINWNSAISMGLTIMIFSPIIEELIFRGFLINLIFKDNLFWIPIIFSAAVFASFHDTANLVQFSVYFGMGVIFGFAYMKTGRLLTSILLHMANNIFGFVGFFYSLHLAGSLLLVLVEILAVGGILFIVDKFRNRQLA